MIYLIITTSIINKHLKHSYENREETYKNSISNTLKLLPSNIIPIIVENNNLSNSYLDNFNINISYTNNNKNIYHHKGVNELEDIKSVINRYNIQDNDIIIKITGRYHPTSSFFFNHILKYENEYDIFMKFFNVCSKKYNENECVLGLYAIRCKYLKDFVYDPNQLSAEVDFAKYIRKTIQKDKIFSYNMLQLRCLFADSLDILDV
jgi:hypothetical protein